MKGYSDYGLQIPPSATGEFYTTCPQCSPQRKKKNVKCLSVNIEKQTWHCHHCAWSGSLKSGIDRKPDYNHWQKPVFRKIGYAAMLEIPAKVISWFAGRGISEMVLYRNKIGFGDIYMPQIEAVTTAIQFPYYRGEEAVNVKYRDGKKNFRMESGAERIFYGLNDVKEQTVIVEGEIDKLSLEEAGYFACVSVPDGAPSPTAKDYSSKFEFLENCEKEISCVKTFVLAVDNDEPGRVLQEELARRLGKERCKVVEWPEGCKDANETLMKHGKAAIDEVLSAAKDYPIQGIYEIRDIKNQVMRLYENDAERGESTGWKELDELYTVRPGEWTLVTGIPGHGKSEFVDNLMVNLMWKKWRFAIFSPENQPLERHIAKLTEKAVGKPFYRGAKERLTSKEVQDAQELLNPVFTFLLPEDDEISVDGILKLAKTAIFRKGVKGIVIDPWNEIDHTRPAGISETEYISKSISKIRRFARACGVHIWVIVHPAKMSKVKQDDGTMDYPVPTPYDCHGSAHWRNKADNAITVHRNFKDETINIHVQKIRFKEIGKVGVCEMTYDKPTGRLFTANSGCPY